MKITITQEFDNAEEAIRALALVGGIIPTAAKPAEVKDKSERKARADKGQPRAPYAPRTAVPAAANASTNPVQPSGDATSGVTDSRVAATNADSKSTVPQAPTNPATSGAVTTAAAGAPFTTNATGTGGPALAESVVPAKSAGVGAAVGAPVPGAVSVAPTAPTADQVQDAIEKLFNKLDYEGTVSVLQRFGVARHKDLAPGQRAEFLRRVEDICAGKYAGTDAWPA